MAALAVVLLGLVPLSPARADDGCPGGGACVEIDVIDGTTRIATKTFDVQAVDDLHDITNTSYALRSKPGTASVPVHLAQATSLNALVEATPGVGDVKYTEVVDPQGRPHPLDQGELAAGPPHFDTGLAPAVWAIDDDTIGYVRPLRTDKPDDVNDDADPTTNGYFTTTAAQGPLVVRVHTTGELITASISATTTTPQLGAPVVLTATLTSAPAHTTYAWDFGDGTTSTAAKPTHAWTSKGTYPVSLSVSAPDGSSGHADGVTVSVQAVTTASPSSPAGTGTDPDKHAPVTGPTKSKGKTSGGKASSTSSQGATSSTGGTGTGSSGSGLLAPPPGTATVPSAGPAASATAPPTTTPVAPTIEGVPVSGILLAAADVPEPAAGPSATAHAARSSAPRLPFSLPGWALPTTVCLLAFAAGGLRESQRARALAGRLARGLRARAPGRMRA